MDNLLCEEREKEQHCCEFSLLVLCLAPEEEETAAAARRRNCVGLLLLLLLLYSVFDSIYTPLSIRLRTREFYTQSANDPRIAIIDLCEFFASVLFLWTTSRRGRVARPQHVLGALHFSHLI